MPAGSVSVDPFVWVDLFCLTRFVFYAIVFNQQPKTIAKYKTTIDLISPFSMNPLKTHSRLPRKKETPNKQIVSMINLWRKRRFTIYANNRLGLRKLTDVQQHVTTNTCNIIIEWLIYMNDVLFITFTILIDNQGQSHMTKKRHNLRFLSSHPRIV